MVKLYRADIFLLLIKLMVFICVLSKKMDETIEMKKGTDGSLNKILKGSSLVSVHRSGAHIRSYLPAYIPN